MYALYMPVKILITEPNPSADFFHCSHSMICNYFLFPILTAMTNFDLTNLWSRKGITALRSGEILITCTKK